MLKVSFRAFIAPENSLETILGSDFRIMVVSHTQVFQNFPKLVRGDPSRIQLAEFAQSKRWKIKSCYYYVLKGP